MGQLWNKAAEIYHDGDIEDTTQRIKEEIEDTLRYMGESLFGVIVSPIKINITLSNGNNYWFKYRVITITRRELIGEILCWLIYREDS